MKPVLQLAGELGIEPRQLTKLRRKHKTEEALLAVLTVWWKETREIPRFLAAGAPQARSERDRDHFTEDQALGYTHESSRALDSAESVSVEYQNVLTMASHSRRAERAQAERTVEDARADAERAAKRLKAYVTWAARNGNDTTSVIAGVERVVRQHEDEQRRAA